jgi:hypothetical protein
VGRVAGTSDHSVLTAAILLLIGVTVVTCYYTVMGDPGYLAVPDVTEARRTIIALAEADELDHRHFCASCLVRINIHIQTCMCMHVCQRTCMCMYVCMRERMCL